MRAIAVVNQKGGCGKTTTAINLAAFLARNQRQTLVVDMDPQGHATLGLMPDVAGLSQTMYDLLAERAEGRDRPLRDITRTVAERLDLAPSDILLSAIPELLRGKPGGENMLSDLLEGVRADYDYVVVDSPPSVGLLTFNALKACAEAIIPVDPSFFSLHGIGKLFETLEVLAKETGHEVTARALVTMYCGRTQFVRDILADIRQHLAGRHFNTVVRHSTKLAEAASHGLPITGYCSRCTGFEDYEALAAEVLQMEAAMPATEQAAGRGRSVDLDGPTAPRPTSEGVVFAIEAQDARRVQLVGDFNGWALDGNDMQPAGRIWTTVLKLQPGRYQYRYVVDGEWQNDPLNNNVEATPFGGHNSVFELNEGSPE
jgi:chromosome partitioning protein